MRLVDADALLWYWDDESSHAEYDMHSGHSIITSINNLPPLHETKGAHWVQLFGKKDDGFAVMCSVCKARFRDYGKGIYLDSCPHCGVVMEGIGLSEDADKLMVAYDKKYGRWRWSDEAD